MAAPDHKPVSMLEMLELMINVDADTLDANIIRSLPIVPNDETSNPFWLHSQMSHPSNAKRVTQLALQYESEGIQAVYTRLAVALCKENINLIRGRVLVQTLPSLAYDTNATIDHARQYAAEFERAEIPISRFCIKIMATGPGVAAAKAVAAQGIPVLGTGVFSVEQAVACSQAGCLYISPYYNEIRVHANPSLWPDCDDPATQHPFSNRIAQMVQAFRQLHAKTGHPQPLIKSAGFISWREVIASAELGCHSATVAGSLLEQWAAMPCPSGNVEDKEASTDAMASFDYSSVDGPRPKLSTLTDVYARESTSFSSQRLEHLLKGDPLFCATSTTVDGQDHWKPCNLEVDYIASNGKAIQEALARDTVARRSVDDALGWFCSIEQQSRELIESQWAIKSKA